jgi:hypothetical protein
MVGNTYELDSLNNIICKIDSSVFPTASWEQKNYFLSKIYFGLKINSRIGKSVNEVNTSIKTASVM